MEGVVEDYKDCPHRQKVIDAIMSAKTFADVLKVRAELCDDCELACMYKFGVTR